MGIEFFFTFDISLLYFCCCCCWKEAPIFHVVYSLRDVQYSRSVFDPSSQFINSARTFCYGQTWRFFHICQETNLWCCCNLYRLYKKILHLPHNTLFCTLSTPSSLEPYCIFYFIIYIYLSFLFFFLLIFELYAEYDRH